MLCNRESGIRVPIRRTRQQHRPWQNRDRTLTFEGLGESFERKADPQDVENVERGANQKEFLEPGVLRVKQAL